MASNNSRGPEVKNSMGALEQMKIEIASELGIPNYDRMNKGDLPARVHGKIGGNMVRRMISNYEALMSNPNNSALIQQSNEIADAQLAQDKQVIQNRYQNILNKEEQEINNKGIEASDANAEVTMS